MISAASYVACGSSDTDTDQGEAGESAGGDAGAGGTPNAGGSGNSSAGSSNVPVGGDASSGGMAGEAPVVGGAAGSAAGGEPGAAGEAAGGAGGAGGDGPLSIPAECVATGLTYVQQVGTASADVFPALDLAGNKLIFGLEGDDSFGDQNQGYDCLVGGPGDDSFYSPGEYSSHAAGGEGADTFHLNDIFDRLYIIDMTSGVDTIGLSQTVYTGLFGSVGGSPQSDQLVVVADYSAGTGSLPASESATAIAYDPATGELWFDPDRGMKGTTARHIGTIMNHSSYTFDPADFVLD